jgi:hypothetical protein
MRHTDPWALFTDEQQAEADQMLNVSRGTRGHERVGSVQARKLALDDQERGSEMILRGPKSN